MLAAEEYVPIDQALGPAGDRYFGDGYRSVQHSVSGRLIDGLLGGNGTVGYPPRWSVDSQSRARDAHLSSVDAVILPLLLLEQCATGGELDALRTLRLTSLDLRAGAHPWDDLDAVPVEARIMQQRDALSVKGTVGSIKVALRLERGDDCSPRETGGESVYGSLFRTTQCRTVIESKPQGSRSLAAHHEVACSQNADAKGLESDYWPGLTLVDYLVVLGQITQALVYTSAGVRRGEAGPLWMRRMRLNRTPTPPAGNYSQFSSEAHIERDRVITRGQSRLHDTVVNARTTSGVSASSAIAYFEGEG